MKKIALIMACVAMALVVSSSCFAIEEPEVVITNAYTCNYLGEPCTEFQAWVPIYYHVEYTIYGPQVTFSVIGLTHVFGAREQMNERQGPGDYTMIFGNMVGDDFEPGNYSATYKIRLRWKYYLMGVATTTTEITIIE